MTNQCEARHKQLMADETTLEKWLDKLGEETHYDHRHKEILQAFNRLMRLATLADEVLSTVDTWR